MPTLYSMMMFVKDRGGSWSLGAGRNGRLKTASWVTIRIGNFSETVIADGVVFDRTEFRSQLFNILNEYRLRFPRAYECPRCWQQTKLSSANEWHCDQCDSKDVSWGKTDAISHR
jgi:DNA-directed RNA polymerase subunit RPC12/RpoP